MKKLTKTKSIRVLKFDFIALNDYYWINWYSWGEKIVKTITLCVKIALTPDIPTPTESTPLSITALVRQKGWSF